MACPKPGSKRIDLNTKEPERETSIATTPAKLAKQASISSQHFGKEKPWKRHTTKPAPKEKEANQHYSEIQSG